MSVIKRSDSLVSLDVADQISDSVEREAYCDLLVALLTPTKRIRSLLNRLLKEDPEAWEAFCRRYAINGQAEGLTPLEQLFNPAGEESALRAEATLNDVYVWFGYGEDTVVYSDPDELDIVETGENGVAEERPPEPHDEAWSGYSQLCAGSRGHPSVSGQILKYCIYPTRQRSRSEQRDS